MDFFAGLEYTGEPFELFGTPHLIALLILLCFNLSFILLKKHKDSTLDKVIRYGMAVILIVNEIGWHTWNIVTDQWTITDKLPLHICTVFVFISPIMLVTKNFRIYEFAYFLGISGALQPILTPDAGMWGFPHFRFFQVLISHGLILSSAVYMTVVQGFRPTWASYKRVLIGTGIYAVFIFILNQIIGSNYLFIAHKPTTASLIDLMPDWPWYIIYLAIMAVVLFFLLYLPFWISDLRKNRNKTVENPSVS